MSRKKISSRTNLINLNNHVDSIINQRKLIINDLYYVLPDLQGRYVALNRTTWLTHRAYPCEDGNWKIEEATTGENKDNSRQYISISIEDNPDYMLVNYVLVMCLGSVSPKIEDRIKSNNWKYDLHMSDKTPVINHINGNTLDNRISNLESTTMGLNAVHGRLMYELELHYGDKYVVRYGKNKAKQQLKYRDGVGVSCKEIVQFNSTHEDLALRGLKSKQSGYTPSQMRYIVDRLGINSSNNVTSNKIMMVV